MGTHNGETTISTFEFFELFPNEDVAIEYFEELRWGEGMYCPYCDSERVTKLKQYPYYLCNDCRQKFTVRTDTVFERSHVPLRKWLYAMYLLETSRKGISSIQLGKTLGVRQATAWFMLHRLREACDIVAEPFSGTVEVDETFVGGSKKNMHYAKKKLLPPGPLGNKTVVLGMRERESGRVISYPIEDRTTSTLSGNILENVKEGSTVYTDDHSGYRYLDEWYDHGSVNHTGWQFADGDVSTNGIESVWAVLKRGFKGTYHHWSKKHMRRYVNEFVFRLNSSKVYNNTIDRMNHLVENAIGKRLTYDDLTGD